MDEQQCECCGRMNSRLFDASRYSDDCVFVCGSCLLRIMFVISKEEGSPGDIITKTVCRDCAKNTYGNRIFHTASGSHEKSSE